MTMTMKGVKTYNDFFTNDNKAINEAVSFDKFKVFADGSISKHDTDVETKAISKWKYDNPVTVVKIVGEISENEIDVVIKMSNGDSISIYGEFGPSGVDMKEKYIITRLDGKTANLSKDFNKYYSESPTNSMIEDHLMLYAEYMKKHRFV